MRRREEEKRRRREEENRRQKITEPIPVPSPDFSRRAQTIRRPPASVTPYPVPPIVVLCRKEATGKKKNEKERRIETI